MDSREWRHRCWRTPLVVVALMLILLGVQPVLQLAWPSNHELSASLRVASHKWQTFLSTESRSSNDQRRELGGGEQRQDGHL